MLMPRKCSCQGNAHACGDLCSRQHTSPILTIIEMIAESAPPTIAAALSRRISVDDLLPWRTIETETASRVPVNQAMIFPLHVVIIRFRTIITLPTNDMRQKKMIILQHGAKISPTTVSFSEVRHQGITCPERQTTMD
jgi:hypothetical protein